MTATPHNLLTTQTKFGKEKIVFNNKTKRYQIYQDDDDDSRLQNPDHGEVIPLRQISWNSANQSRFKQGVKVRIMVTTCTSEPLFLTAKKTTRSLEVGPKNEAAVFTIQGQVQGPVKISTVVQGKKLFVTLTPKSPILLLKSEQRAEESEQTSSEERDSEDSENEDEQTAQKMKHPHPVKVDEQTFIHVGKFGEDLFSLKRASKKAKKMIEVKGKFLQLSNRLESSDDSLCPRANSDTIFMTWPQDEKSKFYLSLSFIVNSMKSDQSLLSDDDIFQNLQSRIEKSRQNDVFSILYPFHVLFNYVIENITNEMVFTQNEAESEEEEDGPRKKKAKKHHSVRIKGKFEELLDDFSQKVQVFTDSLDEKSIDVEFFNIGLRCYGNAIAVAIKTDKGKYPTKKLALVITLAAIRWIDDDLNDDMKINILRRLRISADRCQRKVDDHINIAIGDELLYATFTGHMLSDALEQSGPDVRGSGHMVIIRVNVKAAGNILKHTLCLARKVVELYKLEFIQDYGSLSEKTQLRHHMSNEEKLAQMDRYDHGDRILRKIQVDDCRYIKGNTGIRDCQCKKYTLNDSKKLLDLKCANCGHVHKEFWSYEDLAGIPCLLILVDNGRMGDTFPPTLRAMDLRLRNADKSTVYLNAFTQELGRLCRYTTLDQEDKLPYAVIGTALYNKLSSTLRGGEVAYYSYFASDNKIDPKIGRGGQGDTTGYKAKKSNADFRTVDTVKRNNHYLLKAEPQIGKTGAYLSVLIECRRIVCPEAEELELESDEEMFEEEMVGHKTENALKWMYPYWKIVDHLKELPDKVSNSKYDRFCGPYKYPCEEPPKFKTAQKNSRRQQKKTPPADRNSNQLAAFSTSHRCRDCLTEREQFLFHVRFDPKSHKVREPVCISIPDIPHYRSILKPKIGSNPETSSMIFIMTPSYNRQLTATLNLTHLMTDHRRKNKKYIHIVFVRKHQFDQYKLAWGDSHAIVEIPENMTDIAENVSNGGIGYTRRFIQRFADKAKIDSFFMLDDNIVYIYSSKVSEDMKIHRGSQGQLPLVQTSLWQILDKINQIGNIEIKWNFDFDFEPHEEYEDDFSETIAAFTGPQDDYAIIGMTKMRGVTKNNFAKPYAKKHVASLYWINNKKLLEEDLLYKPWWAREDLELNNACDQAGMNVLKMYMHGFRKVRSKDLQGMYEWTDKTRITDDTPLSKQPEQKIALILLKYLQTLKIKSFMSDVCTRNDILLSLKQKLEKEKKCKKGARVLLISSQTRSLEHVLVSNIKKWKLHQNTQQYFALGKFLIILIN